MQLLSTRRVQCLGRGPGARGGRTATAASSPREQLAPGRAERGGPVQILVAERPQERFESAAVRPASSATVSSMLTLGHARRGRHCAWSMSSAGVGHAIAARHGPQPARALRVALGDVMEHHTDRPFLAGTTVRHWSSVHELAKAMASSLAAAKSSARAAAALTRHVSTLPVAQLLHAPSARRRALRSGPQRPGAARGR